MLSYPAMNANTARTAEQIRNTFNMLRLASLGTGTNAKSPTTSHHSFD